MDMHHKNMNERVGRAGLGWLMLAALLLLQGTAWGAARHVLRAIDFQRLAGDEVRIVLDFDGPAPEPLSFVIANPPRLALDFPDTRNTLTKRFLRVEAGAAQSINTAQSRDRTRVVVNLARMVPYQIKTDGNQVVVVLSPGQARTLPVSEEVTAPATIPTRAPATGSLVAERRVTRIDFRRGPDGSGRVLIQLSDPNIPVDIRQQGSRVIVDLDGAAIPPSLQRRMDVTDFATPVETIDARSEGGRSQILIRAHGNFSQLGYQTGDTYTVEVRPVSEARKAAERKKKVSYQGERLSLNFQDIEVRSVLQLIADFTGLNIVVSDDVTGSLTLRLKNVPWDQALDIIMKTKGLAMRRQGNVLFIDKAENIAAREKRELQDQQAVEELAPLRTEIITLNYADAAEMAKLIKSGGGGAQSLLSKRGSVTLDRRTNTLLVQDTPRKLEEIRNLIKKLDVPVRQVMIESRIVTASEQFTRELGVSFTAANTDQSDDQTITSDLKVDLPATNPAGSLGITLAKIPLGAKLDLELSAAEIESRAEIVASPRIITSNKTTARIEQGVEIPYEEATSSGATNIAFKKAVLSLEVTPHITRDERINMKLVVNRDSVGEVFNNVPSIDTREVQTQVLVDNGQTIVLGGIFEENVTRSNRKVPFFGDLPGLGHLFRTDSKRTDKKELLIFVTPKIIDEHLNPAR